MRRSEPYRKKRYTAEEIIHKLREADVLLGQDKTVAEACKQLGVTEQTYYRWRKAYGGMKVDQAKRLKELEAENTRLISAPVRLSWNRKLRPDSLSLVTVMRFLVMIQ